MLLISTACASNWDYKGIFANELIQTERTRLSLPVSNLLKLNLVFTVLHACGFFFHFRKSWLNLELVCLFK